MAQLAIKGHKTRGKEVIEILEMLGGVNSNNLLGNDDFYEYIIDKDNKIEGYPYIFGNDEDEITYLLDELLEKFPYKIGDKVKCKNYDDIYTIDGMTWNSACNKIMYHLAEKNVRWWRANYLYSVDTTSDRLHNNIK